MEGLKGSAGHETDSKDSPAPGQLAATAGRTKLLSGPCQCTTSRRPNTVWRQCQSKSFTVRLIPTSRRPVSNRVLQLCICSH